MGNYPEEGIMAARRSRFATRVIHRHQAGDRTMLRVSELTFVGEVPHAILYWIDNAGVKVPITVALRTEALRPAAGVLGLSFYAGLTVDPRFIDA
jgi:hypothetical protein